MTITTQTQPTLVDTIWPAGASASRSALLIVLGSVFLAVCAQIYVPLEPVPITMQTFGVLVLGMAYGWRLGMASAGLYVLEGAAGLPVFAGFAGGLPVLFGPTRLVEERRDDHAGQRGNQGEACEHEHRRDDTAPRTLRHDVAVAHGGHCRDRPPVRQTDAVEGLGLDDSNEQTGDEHE